MGLGGPVTGSADFCPRGHWCYSKPSRAVQPLWEGWEEGMGGVPCTAELGLGKRCGGKSDRSPFGIPHWKTIHLNKSFSSALALKVFLITGETRGKIGSLVSPAAPTILSIFLKRLAGCSHPKILPAL